jgi:uncharacterized membrane protein
MLLSPPEASGQSERVRNRTAGVSFGWVDTDPSIPRSMRRSVANVIRTCAPAVVCDDRVMNMQGWETHWHKYPAVRSGDQLSRGERAADRMRNGMGSWPFVFVFFLIMVLWAVANSVFYLGGEHGKHGFDPYPYILLNLFLSMLAGVQAAALLIASKRADAISSAIAVHTERNTDDIKSLINQNTALINENTALTMQVKNSTDLLEQIHRHVSALTPDAGATDPDVDA